MDDLESLGTTGAARLQHMDDGPNAVASASSAHQHDRRAAGHRRVESWDSSRARAVRPTPLPRRPTRPKRSGGPLLDADTVQQLKVRQRQISISRLCVLAYA